MDNPLCIEFNEFDHDFPWFSQWIIHLHGKFPMKSSIESFFRDVQLTHDPRGPHDQSPAWCWQFAPSPPPPSLESGSAAYFPHGKKNGRERKKITYSLVPVNPREKITHVASCGSSIFGLEIIWIKKGSSGKTMGTVFLYGFRPTKMGMFTKHTGDLRTWICPYIYIILICIYII